MGNQSNENIHQLQNLIDIVKDEYGNYYDVTGTTTRDDKLLKVKLTNIYFEKAFSRVFLTEDIGEEYKHQHIGAFLQDLVNARIENVKNKNRKIFYVKDLLESGIEVTFTDQTVRHPRSRQH